MTEGKEYEQAPRGEAQILRSPQLVVSAISLKEAGPTHKWFAQKSLLGPSTGV